MHLKKFISQGRISEILGKKAVNLDKMIKNLRFDVLAKKNY